MQEVHLPLVQESCDTFKHGKDCDLDILCSSAPDVPVHKNHYLALADVQ